jgi:hypothetical protein
MIWSIDLCKEVWRLSFTVRGDSSKDNSITSKKRKDILS